MVTELDEKQSYKTISKICERLLEENFRETSDITNFLENNFSISLITSSNKRGLLTGYYEPEIKAYKRYKKGAYPIYKKNLKMYEKSFFNKSRKEINQGALKNKGLEIAWAENEIELFFLQIQGSGRLKFKNGELMKVRYAGDNSRKYTSIGRLLLQRGQINKNNVSMYSIKNWLYKNKDKARNLMEENERYIYFEEYLGEIKGSSNLNLTSFVSIAVDPKYHQMGDIIIIKEISNKENFYLTIAHDTGSAIKGKDRIDLFTGYGKKAEKVASNLNEKIHLWKLIPKIK